LRISVIVTVSQGVVPLADALCFVDLLRTVRTCNRKTNDACVRKID